MATGRLPIVVVLGATGAGKSKLAIEIAKFFCGEIISADSMQIYKGLDIITNKVTEEEQQGCPHHLMSYIDVEHKYYNVVDFRDAALPIINNIISRKKLPIIVGGTNYYIESLLWDFLIDKRSTSPPSASNLQQDQAVSKHMDIIDQSAACVKTSTSDSRLFQKDAIKIRPGQQTTADSVSSSTPESSSCSHASLTTGIARSDTDAQEQNDIVDYHEVSKSTPMTGPDSAAHGSCDARILQDSPDSDLCSGDSLLRQLMSRSSIELYAELQRVDPEVALLHHPNNKRKIVRALHVFYETGQTMSSILKDQHQGEGNLKSGPLRFPNPCMLWIKCDKAVLDQRLDDRVDDMIQRGLIRELDSFYNRVQMLEEPRHSSSSVDDGFDYTHGILQLIGFKEFGTYLKLTPEERDSEQGKIEFDRGVYELKAATRKYARKQIKWIKNRFCARPGSNVPPVYAVDSTDLTQWTQTVQEALDVVTAFLKGEVPKKPSESYTRKVNAVPTRNVCQACEGQIFIRLDEWEAHLKSKKHKHYLKAISKQREQLSSLLNARASHLSSLEPTGLNTTEKQDKSLSLVVHNLPETAEELFCLETASEKANTEIL